MVETFVPRKIKKSVNGFHSLECHNFHIRRYGHCLYCEQGSVPCEKSLIVERLGLDRESRV